VRAVGGDPKANKARITDEELRGILASQGSLSPQERELIGDVFDAGETALREVMVPRTEVEFLDATTSARTAARTVADLPYSRYPVVRESHDDVIGFVHIRDILSPDLSVSGVRVEDLVREVLFMPASKRVLPAMAEMRDTGTHLAIVVDEYGGTAGIVTLEDLVEELVGDIRDEYDVAERTDDSGQGDREVDGLLNLEDFEDEVGVELPDGPYETVAGYVVAALGRLPALGESVQYDDHVLTIVELDGHRASRIRVSRAAETGSSETDGSMGQSEA
jgi:putative hemolysin